MFYELNISLLVLTKCHTAHGYFSVNRVTNLRSRLFVVDLSIGGLQPIFRDPKIMMWQPCWMTEPFVLSSNMAAMPLSFWISRDWLQSTYR